MEFVKFSPSLAGSWDELVKRSDDGWMFGLSSWLEMTSEIPVWGLENLSFALFDGAKMLAAMPLQLTVDGRLCSTVMGPSGPVVAGGISTENRNKTLAEIFHRIREIAREQDAWRIEVSISPESQASRSAAATDNFLLSYGFEDASTHSWIIDLRGPKQEIEKNVSRNVWRKVKEAKETGYAVRPIRGREEIGTYYDIHCETYHRTGATPHPKEYFLGIYDQFTARGLSKIWVAVDQEDRPVAFTNIAVCKNAALYWTTCCRDKDFGCGVYYLLLWHAIESAKEESIEWFDCAEAFPDALAGSKEKGLSDFKRKFGGTLHPYIKAHLNLKKPPAPPWQKQVQDRLGVIKRKLELVLGKKIVGILSRAAWVIFGALRGK